MDSTTLLTIPSVSLSIVSDPSQTDAPPLFTGVLSLLARPLPSTSSSFTPPPIPHKPSSIRSEKLNLPGGFDVSRSPSPTSTPPLPPRSPTSSSPSKKYLELTITLQGDHEPMFVMPVDTSSQNSPPESTNSSYLLPNLTGTDPSTLASGRQQQNGWVRLELPRGIDGEDRETFEAIIYGFHPALSGSSNGGGGGATTIPLERNQLYVVDEDSGKVLGQLENDGASAVSLEEDQELKDGHLHDGPAQVTELDTFNLDGKEAVVINSLGSSSANEPSWNGLRFSVKPLSAYYTPAPNPESSAIISVGNFLSHGIVIGSSLISAGLEKSAGKYISTRPETTTPLTFKDTTKGRFDRGNQVTGKAVQYTGIATGYVGNFAANIGDRIGKATGIQHKPGDPPPKGLKGIVHKSLIAINTVGDHLDAGGKTLIDSAGKSSSQVVHHKWGSEARGIADSAGGSVKHCALVYIDAKGVTRRALIKAVGKGALKAKMADGSQLYLTDSSDTSSYELKQLENAAVSQSSNSTNPFDNPSTNPFDNPSPPSYSNTTALGGRGASGSGSSTPDHRISNGGYPYKSYDQKKNQ